MVDFFSILVDESRDVSMKEQMAVVLRYVDKSGSIIERFIGLEHVATTTAISLKEAIDGLFSRHGLSISRLRGQGYDGASNMHGEFNGLKALILKENPCVFLHSLFCSPTPTCSCSGSKKKILKLQVFSFLLLVLSTLLALRLNGVTFFINCMQSRFLRLSIMVRFVAEKD